MSSLSRELVFLILQFLEEEKFKESVHRLEESGYFFNMKYFEEKALAGEWDEVEKYLSCRPPSRSLPVRKAHSPATNWNTKQLGHWFWVERLKLKDPIMKTPKELRKNELKRVCVWNYTHSSSRRLAGHACGTYWLHPHATRVLQLFTGCGCPSKYMRFGPQGKWFDCKTYSERANRQALKVLSMK